MCKYPERHVCTVRDLMSVQKITASMTRWTPPQTDPNPPSSPLSKFDNLIKLGTKRRRRKRGLASYNIVAWSILLLNVSKSHNNQSLTGCSTLFRESISNLTIYILMLQDAKITEQNMRINILESSGLPKPEELIMYEPS
jgi:hypothetical protein